MSDAYELDMSQRCSAVVGMFKARKMLARMTLERMDGAVNPFWLMRTSECVSHQVEYHETRGYNILRLLKRNF